MQKAIIDERCRRTPKVEKFSSYPPRWERSEKIKNPFPLVPRGGRCMQEVVGNPGGRPYKGQSSNAQSTKRSMFLIQGTQKCGQCLLHYTFTIGSSNVKRRAPKLYILQNSCTHRPQSGRTRWLSSWSLTRDWM